jgi:hypothetical protein
LEEIKMIVQKIRRIVLAATPVAFGLLLAATNVHAHLSQQMPLVTTISALLAAVHPRPRSVVRNLQGRHIDAIAMLTKF